MGTSEKVYGVLTESVPGMTVAEIAGKAKPRNVRDPIIATRSALYRLYRANKARGEKCKDGQMRWRRV